MPTANGQRFYDLLRLHMENGVSVDAMAFTEMQRARVKVCMEVWKMFATDPYVNVKSILMNKYGRTPAQVANDMATINYIESFYAGGNKAMSRAKVRHTADRLMRDGADSGDLKAMASGAALLMKVDQLEQPDNGMDDEDTSRLPVIVTTNVHDKYANKRNVSEGEMRRLRAKYGFEVDQWQELVEEKVKEAVPADGTCINPDSNNSDGEAEADV